jgi:hypothetical protein
MLTHPRLRAGWKGSVPERLRQNGLTRTLTRVYDANMPISGRIRPTLCLLLAVSTAIGTVGPVRACNCTTTYQGRPFKPAAVKTARQASPRVAAAKSCCQGAVEKRSCCSASPDPRQRPPCKCNDRAHTLPPGQPNPVGTDHSACECILCDCGLVHTQPATQVPIQSSAELGEHLTLESAATLVLVPLPCEWPSDISCGPSIPPADLIITLSRLTC